MKIPKYIKKTIFKMAKLYSLANKESLKLSKWLDKKNIEFDGCDELGCAYSNIQDGFDDDFIKALEKFEEVEE